MTGFFVSRRNFGIIHGRPFIQGQFTVYNKNVYVDKITKKGNKNVNLVDKSIKKKMKMGLDQKWGTNYV